MSWFRIPAALAVPAVAATCSSVERDPSWYRQAPTATLSHAPPAARLDPLDEDAVLGIGERACYEIEADNGSERRRWTMQLTLKELFGGSPFYAQPEPSGGWIRTRDGSRLRAVCRDATIDFAFHDDSGQVEIELREAGRDPYATTVSYRLPSHAWQASVASEATHGIWNLLAALVKVDYFFDVLIDVVRAPSPGSMLASFGRINVSLEFPRTEGLEVVERDTPFGRIPTVWLPVRLMANDQPALDCQLLLTWKRSPLLLTAGLLQLEGRHPDDPKKRVTVRLGEAQRGESDAVPADLRRLRVGMAEEEVPTTLPWKVLDWTDSILADGRLVELVSFSWNVHPGERRVIREGGAVFHDGALVYASNPREIRNWLSRHGAASGSLPQWMPYDLLIRMADKRDRSDARAYGLRRLGSSPHPGARFALLRIAGDAHHPARDLAWDRLIETGDEFVHGVLASLPTRPAAATPRLDAMAKRLAWEAHLLRDPALDRAWRSRIVAALLAIVWAEQTCEPLAPTLAACLEARAAVLACGRPPSALRALHPDVVRVARRLGEDRDRLAAAADAWVERLARAAAR